jgi:hypothetical protein
MIFRRHFLGGADWKACIGLAKINRGQFFHAVYRCKEQIGRACFMMQPYALFPLDEYFGAARGAIASHVQGRDYVGEKFKKTLRRSRTAGAF